MINYYITRLPYILLMLDNNTTILQSYNPSSIIKEEITVSLLKRDIKRVIPRVIKREKIKVIIKVIRKDKNWYRIGDRKDE